MIPHPNFDKIKLINDFVVLKWEDPLEFDEFVKPIELPGEFDKLPDGTKCKVSGWGMMENDEKPKDLRSATVSIVNQTTCQKNYNTTRVKFGIKKSMCCAGVADGQRDACSGDSVSLCMALTSQFEIIFIKFFQGGPLMCNGKLFGVVSAGYGCGLKGFPGIYARGF